MTASLGPEPVARPSADPVANDDGAATGDDAPGDDASGDDASGADAITLPWWQNPINIVTMLVIVSLLAGMVGWLVRPTGDDVVTSDVDVGFLQDMRVHHEQAIDMGRIFLERPDTHPGLRTIANGIQVGQSIEIGIMIQLLTDMGAPTVGEEGQAMAWMGMPMDEREMPGMATDTELQALADSSGAEADELFIDLMTAHHQGGIDMATEAAARAESDSVRRYAEVWGDSQAAEIAELEGLRADS